MSGQRISRRVLEKEAQLLEQKRKQEALALTAVRDNLASLFSELNKSTCENQDFELPAEFLLKDKTKRNKRSIAEGSDDDDELNVEDIDGIPFPRYRVLKKNLYRPPILRSVAAPGDCPTCDCKPVSGCGANCHNKLLFMECIGGQCPSLTTALLCQPVGGSSQSLRSGVGRARSLADGNTTLDMAKAAEDPTEESSVEEEEEEVMYCANTAIQTKSFPKVQVFPTTDLTSPPPPSPLQIVPAQSSLTKNKRRRSSQEVEEAAHSSRGFGLRLLEPVRRGTIIIEYLGEVITAAEGLRRMQEYVLGDDFYFAGLDGGLMLDAKTMGSAARFANHSCAPTCMLQKWTVMGECRLVLVAKKDLPAGSEITYNYNYFDDSLEGLRGMQRQTCLCGAPNCSGTIGGRVSKNKNKRVSTATSTSSKVQSNERHARTVRRGAGAAAAAADAAGVQQEDAKEDETAVDSDSDEEGVEELWERCQDLLPHLCHPSATASATASASEAATCEVQAVSSASMSTMSMSMISLTKDTPALPPMDPAAAAASSLSTSSLSAAATSASVGGEHFNETGPDRDRRRRLGQRGTAVSTKKLSTEHLAQLISDIQVCTQRAAVLNGGAPVVSSRFISNTDDIVVQLKQFSADVAAMLQDCEDWKAEHATLFTGTLDGGILVDLIKAQNLLNKAPKYVKMEQVSRLEVLVKTASKAQRAVENVLQKIRSAGENCAGKPHFDELIGAFNALEAALPLNCGDSNLLKLLQHYEAMALWVRQHVSPVALPYMRAEGGRDGAIADPRSEEAALFGCLQRVVTAYFVRDTPPSTTAIEKTIKEESCCASDKSEGPLPDLERVLATEVVPNAFTTSEFYQPIQTETNPNSSVAASSVTISSVTASVITAPAKGPKKKASSQVATTAVATSLVLPLLADPFWASQWLDSRLSTYMEKLAIEEAQVPDQLLCSTQVGSAANEKLDGALQVQPHSGILGIEKSLEIIAANSNAQNFVSNVNSAVGADAASAVKPKKGKNGSTNIVEEDPAGEILFCFCRLPEEEGECDILSECSVCLNWYHPPCINAAGLSLSAASRVKAFVCPVCMHLSNQLGNFSRPPQEWKFIKPARPTRPKESLALTGAGKGRSQSGANANRKTGEKIKIETAQLSLSADSGTAADEGGDFKSGATEGEEVIWAGKRKRNDQITPGAPRSKDKDKEKDKDFSVFTRGALLAGGKVKVKAAPVVKTADFLTVAEFQAILQNESKLPIIGSPLSLLLILARKYVLSWQEQCAAFLSSATVRAAMQSITDLLQQLQNDPLSARAPLPERTISAAELVRETKVFQRCLQLYLQLRIVRIRGQECSVLRRLAWVITTSTVLRGVRAHEGADSAELHPRYVPTVEEYSVLIAAGNELFAPTAVLNPPPLLALPDDPPATALTATGVAGLVNSTGARLLSRCVDVLSAYTQLRRRAMTCSSRDAARHLVAEVDHLLSAQAVWLEGAEFWIARVKCLSRQVVSSVKVSHTISCADDALGVLDPLQQAVTGAPAPDGTADAETDTDGKSSCSAGVAFTSAESFVVPVARAEGSATESGDANCAHSESLTSIATLTTSASFSEPNVREYPFLPSTEVNTDKEEATAAEAMIERSVLEEPTVPATYCWCRAGDDGTPMVCCDGCEEWFHCRCVGLSGPASLQPRSSSSSSSSSLAGRATKTKTAHNSGDKRTTKTKKSKKAADLAEESAYWCISCSALSGQIYPYCW